MIPLFLLFFLLFFVSRVIGVRSGHFRRRASRGRRDPLDVGGCQAAIQGIDEEVVAQHLMVMRIRRHIAGQACHVCDQINSTCILDDPTSTRSEVNSDPTSTRSQLGFSSLSTRSAQIPAQI